MNRVALSALAEAKGLAGGPFGSSLVGKDYVDQGVPVIRGANMSLGRYVGGEFVFVSQEKFESDLARNTAQPGDVVFTQRGTLGQVALVPDSGSETYVISQSQMRLRPSRERADAAFIYYACSTPDFNRQIVDNAISTGVPHINLGILGRLEIPCPSLGEQRAIAEVLGALDDKIAANASVVERSMALAIALAASSGDRVEVAEIAEHGKRQLKPSDFDAEVAHFSIPAFDAGELPEKVTGAAIKSNKFVIDQPVVLASKLNPRTPRVWNVSVPPAEMSLASTEFVVLRPKGIDVSELWASLSDSDVWKRLQGMVAGTSNSHQRIKPAEILGSTVADPRLLSTRIRSALRELGMRRHVAQQESEHLAGVRDALLPGLMSGKIRVKDAERVVEKVT